MLNTYVTKCCASWLMQLRKVIGCWRSLRGCELDSERGKRRSTSCAWLMPYRNVDYQSLTATCDLHLPTTNVFLNCFTKPAQPPLSQCLHLKKTAKPQSYLNLRKLQSVLPTIIPANETQELIRTLLQTAKTNTPVLSWTQIHIHTNKYMCICTYMYFDWRIN